MIINHIYVNIHVYSRIACIWNDSWRITCIDLSSSVCLKHFCFDNIDEMLKFPLSYLKKTVWPWALTSIVNVIFSIWSGPMVLRCIVQNLYNGEKIRTQYIQNWTKPKTFVTHLCPFPLDTSAKKIKRKCKNWDLSDGRKNSVKKSSIVPQIELHILLMNLHTKFQFIKKQKPPAFVSIPQAVSVYSINVGNQLISFLFFVSTYLISTQYQAPAAAFEY